VSHPVLRRLADPDPALRRAACRDAASDPTAVLLVDALAKALGDPERAVARAASASLAALGREVPEVVPALRRALAPGDPARRVHAAVTLAELAPPTPALLPALVEGLGAEDGDVRWAAARLLVDAGRLHGEVFALLRGLALGPGDPKARAMACACLRALAPDAPATARALCDVSREDDPALRRAALTALAGAIDPPREVASRLAEVAEGDPDPACRRLADAARRALARRAAGAP